MMDDIDPKDYENKMQTTYLAPWQRRTTCEICSLQFKLLRMDTPHGGDMFCIAMLDHPNGCKPEDCSTLATPGRWAKWYEWGKARLEADQKDNAVALQIRRARRQLEFTERGGWREDPMEDGRVDNWKGEADDLVRAMEGES